ncbi:PaaI family thioesterase [bacterium]|nr:PaaI family thioesterase [bacterium]
MELSDNNRCFGCGKLNPIGLQMSFSYDPDKGTSFANLTLPLHFQGWEGVAHGGIVTTILDEALAHAAFSRNIPCVTGELTVRFKKPVPLEKKLSIYGEIQEIKGSIIYISGYIKHNDTILAHAKGKMVRI